MAVQTFKCLDCDKLVEYERKVLPTVRGKRVGSPETATKVAYLTCGNGHTNPYTVNA